MATVVLRGERVELVKAQYRNKALAIQAVCETGEPYCTLSVNLPESDGLPQSQCYLKTWSENEGFKEALEAAGLVRDTGKRAVTGFVEASLVEVLF